MERKGILMVVSGFSGAGKGTIMKKVVERCPDCALSVSATTRAPREGEKHGVDYFYVTREEFERMIAEGELLEYASYQGNYYGTPRRYVEQALAEGRDVILEIEVQGASKIRKIFPEAVTIFVTPPDAKELMRRLSGRGTESAEAVQGRLQRATEEADSMPLYDYLLVNDDLEEAVGDFINIMKYEHTKMFRMRDKAEAIASELTALVGERR